MALTPHPYGLQHGVLRTLCDAMTARQLHNTPYPCEFGLGRGHITGVWALACIVMTR